MVEPREAGNAMEMSFDEAVATLRDREHGSILREPPNADATTLSFDHNGDLVHWITREAPELSDKDKDATDWWWCPF